VRNAAVSFASVRYRAIIISALLFALLLLAEGILSFHTEDQIIFSSSQEMARIVFGGGAVYFAEFQFGNPGGAGLRFHRASRSALNADQAVFQNASCLGFTYLGSVKHSAYHYHIIGIPIWFPLILLGVVCAAAIHRYRRDFYNRWIARLCVKCGYDIRATPDRCPECGTLVQPVPRGLTATLRSMRRAGFPGN
jgi:hypothetical protein